MAAGRSCVFLDRDGVINRAPAPGEYVRRWEEFVFLPGIVEWIKLFRRLGCLVIVVTNQRGVALRRMSLEAVEEIHRRMREELEAAGAPVDAVYCCPHEEGECECRKPRPGLIRQAQRDFGIDLRRSVLIGDSARDRDLAARCGILFVKAGGGKLLAAREPAQRR